LVNPKATRLSRLARLLVASVAALVTRGLCQFEISVRQRHRVRPSPMGLFGQPRLLEIGGELIDGLGADFGVGDVIDRPQVFWGFAF